MCRSIHNLHNFEPAATNDEVHAAALQYVRKIAGTTKPSKANQEAFDRAVHEIAHITGHLLRGPRRDDAAEEPRGRGREEARPRHRLRALRDRLSRGRPAPVATAGVLRNTKITTSSSRMPQSTCSTTIQSGRGRKNTTPTIATKMIATAMRSRSSARGRRLAALSPKTKVSTDVAATMMLRTHAWGVTRSGATALKIATRATVTQLRTR